MSVDWYIDINPTEFPNKRDNAYLGFTAPPQGTGKGIFEYITKINGSDAEVRAAQAKLSQLTPETAAVYKALNLLPEGGLKKWLMANPVQFWKMVVQIFTGRKFTTGDYVAGERLNDQVYCNGDIGRKQVSDDMVKAAHQVFNQLFGVRIATTEDLDALDAGVAEYKAREVSKGISDKAINRAVFLKQKFYPISTYNKSCWDLSYFEKYPLVDKIPDYEIGKWYTGDLIGGAQAIEGLIPIDAKSVIGQDIGGTFSAEGTYKSTTQQLAEAEQKKSEAAAAVNKKTTLYIVAGAISVIAVGMAIFVVVRKNH